MGSMNRVTLLGRLGKDPELFSGASQVCKFSLATDKKWTDKSGQRREETQWHRVVCFGKTAETASRYLSKGSEVLIEGSIKYDSYEKEGRTIYTTDIIADRVTFVGSARGNAVPPTGPREGNWGGGQGGGQGGQPQQPQGGWQGNRGNQFGGGQTGSWGQPGGQQ